MSQLHQDQTGAKRMLSQAVPMTGSGSESVKRESELVKLFIEITGENEAQARSTFIFVSRDDEESSTNGES